MDKVGRKTFMQVGMSFIDVTMCVGISFCRVDGSYVYVMFSYDTGQTLPVELKNRSELTKFLLQLDGYMDDNDSMKSIKEMISKIEALSVCEISNKRGADDQRYIYVEPADE